MNIDKLIDIIDRFLTLLLSTALPLELKEWASLKIFNLKANKLKIFPPEFCVSWKLCHTLLLTANPIQFCFFLPSPFSLFPSLFFYNTLLTSLLLSPFRELPQHFAYLQSLVKCDLAFCSQLKKCPLLQYLKNVCVVWVSMWCMCFE